VEWAVLYDTDADYDVWWPGISVIDCN